MRRAIDRTDDFYGTSMRLGCYQGLLVPKDTVALRVVDITDCTPAHQGCVVLKYGKVFSSTIAEICCCESTLLHHALQPDERSFLYYEDRAFVAPPEFDQRVGLRSIAEIMRYYARLFGIEQRIFEELIFDNTPEANQGV